MEKYDRLLELRDPFEGYLIEEKKIEEPKTVVEVIEVFGEPKQHAEDDTDFYKENTFENGRLAL